ncbi:MAG: hypothetical protein KF871_06965 [Hydrogenophaga sp.]|uniref:hypothetical protein n=1 Tax=Hydrogenophaga sp. TaxID=1904254 RepID=UPI001DFE9B72|nr:hypothetical protein [Hydrogenophaga sp.]MBX3609623.1 hypothetical protein [Hydrogenophaga sp.]
MAMLGQAALAMWWDMAPERLAEFGHWHSHEHFPERLALPGFRRASRWLAADGGEGVFTCYEIAEPADLGSPAYQARLNAPTPWSTAMMPHHRHMQRAQCEVLASVGAFVAGHLLTLRLAALDDTGIALWRAWARTHAGAPGLAGVHLLRHAPPAIPTTTEQRIRGGDGAPACVALVSAYDADALSTAASMLATLPGHHGEPAARFRLAMSALAGELADIEPPAHH